jgi:hypothetical protein
VPFQAVEPEFGSRARCQSRTPHPESLLADNFSVYRRPGAAVGAGFDVVFQGSRPPEEPESCPQGYLLLRKA